MQTILRIAAITTESLGKANSSKLFKKRKLEDDAMLDWKVEWKLSCDTLEPKAYGLSSDAESFNLSSKTANRLSLETKTCQKPPSRLKTET